MGKRAEGKRCSTYTSMRPSWITLAISHARGHSWEVLIWRPAATVIRNRTEHALTPATPNILAFGRDASFWDMITFRIGYNS